MDAVRRILQQNPMLFWTVASLLFVASNVGMYFLTKRESKLEAKRLAKRQAKLKQRSLAEILKARRVAEYDVWRAVWPPGLWFGVPAFIMWWILPTARFYIALGYLIIMLGFLLDAITVLVRRFIIDTVESEVRAAVEKAVRDAVPPKDKDGAL